jgi:hypothetical protein
VCQGGIVRVNGHGVVVALCKWGGEMVSVIE